MPQEAFVPPPVCTIHRRYTVCGTQKSWSNVVLAAVAPTRQLNCPWHTWW